MASNDRHHRHDDHNDHHHRHDDHNDHHHKHDDHHDNDHHHRHNGGLRSESWVVGSDGLSPHSLCSPRPLFNGRAFAVGIGGPLDAGKTALMLALCTFLRDKYSNDAVTNDIFTKEEGEERIRAVETDNLAANFSRELADHIVHIIDVSDKITQANNLLVINRTDLATVVGADLAVMDRNTFRMGDSGTLLLLLLLLLLFLLLLFGFIICAQVKHEVGVEEILNHILDAWEAATGNRSVSEF